MTNSSQDSRHLWSGGWPDRAVTEIAGGQAANISHAQLRALGVSTSAIKRAVARGRLHRVHHGVYSLLPARGRPLRAAEHAAVLACGPQAVLSHLTAARLHGLEPPGRADRVHLTIEAGNRRSREGIVVHRTSRLDPAERLRRDRLPVTTVARTMVDLAGQLDPRVLEVLFGRALRRTSPTKLREAIDRRPHRPGVGMLLALLDPARPSSATRSHAERRLLELIRRSGLPLPETDVSLGRYTPDLLWRAQRVIVEYDSDEFHFGPAAARWDAVRHNYLSSQGFEVLHVTWDELSRHPERVLVQIAGARAQRGGW